MKVLTLPFVFYPDPVGGTEIHVKNLAHKIGPLGVETVIAAPGSKREEYSFEGLKVHRYPYGGDEINLLKLYGEGEEKTRDEFCRILDKEKPDLVHGYALTAGVNVRLYREVKKRGLPLVFTHITPTTTCQRGTLKRWGREVCSGLLEEKACTGCTLEGIGVPIWMAHLLKNLPSALSKKASQMDWLGKGRTALAMRALVEERHSVIRETLSLVDHFISVSHWGMELLKTNGVPLEKTTLSQHGLDLDVFEVSPKGQDSNKKLDEKTLKIAFFGRLDPTKGIHLLLEALELAPQLDLQLKIYGINQKVSSNPYLHGINKAIDKDSRVEVLPPIPHKMILQEMSNYHLVAIPSQLPESGPLVALEAFAAGTPVMGSRLGGIAELVTHGRDGLLLDNESPQEWADTLARLCQDRNLLARLTEGITSPKTMKEVATETLEVYRRVIKEVP